MTYLKLNDVNLEFPIYNTQSFSLRHSLVRAATGGILNKKEKSNLSVSALKNINLSLKEGDRLGLIGHNGSGKTTLLKLLAGVYAPTSGTIQVKGEVSTLFDVLCGTHNDMTGNENLYISSLIRGKSIQEVKRTIRSMGEFTELGNYLYIPMRTYSSGMRLRIGFSAATEGNPDILLIDEVFGTGDKGFVNKSVERITSLIKRAGLLVFSSHSEALLTQICNKIMILEHGEIKAIGDVKEMLSLYKKDNP